MSSRYVVGIDLGTTNSSIAYVDAEAKKPVPKTLAIPQIVQKGVVEERNLLPSFLYLPGAGELPAGSLKLPWAAERDFAVGEFARNHGGLVPTRLVASAKSWLCHAGIDRRGPVLPWKAPEGSRMVSPLEAATLYLKHMAEAWNNTIATGNDALKIEKQDIILTVPASFDAVARELTVEAARAAGLEHVTLLEEPQAAFYAWIEGSHDKWRKQVEAGDAILICDVGGGTTDLTLISVEDDQGTLALSRVAVGDHILLGGDNMDLALAHHLQQQLTAKGTKLDAGQQLMLWHGCRAAKEKLFAEPDLAGAIVTVVGRGKSVIGGTIKTELLRGDVERLLVEGFFPKCPLNAQPQRGRTGALQELGLPYASDPAATKHVAHFLQRQAEVLEKRTVKRGKKPGPHPTCVLFNGGVFKAEPLRERVLDVLNDWAKDAGGSAVKELKGNDLDLAVARGAAYYGMVRRGKGIRIRGGTARSYYVGIETAMPAVPGARPPIKALCVVPFGMEEGSESDVPGQEFGLIIGEPVDFRFLSSTVRQTDTVGTFVEEWEGEIEELPPLSTTLEASKGQSEGQTVPVHLHSKVTEVGTLELSCINRDASKRWKLELNVRERSE